MSHSNDERSIPVKLGQSWFSSPPFSQVSMRYDHKPEFDSAIRQVAGASVDLEHRSGSLQVMEASGSNNAVRLSWADPENDESTAVRSLPTFTGVLLESGATDCTLVYDPIASCFVLERLDMLVSSLRSSHDGEFQRPPNRSVYTAKKIPKRKPRSVTSPSAAKRKKDAAPCIIQEKRIRALRKIGAFVRELHFGSLLSLRRASKKN
mmetsp:Transcript_82317/g.164542  ORF Transcript_82317/g.164542 Transcript_82317/m.164542 type:complete len:207 (+) Transcript_82317:325-945(+)